jgi:hypothetical protein
MTEETPTRGGRKKHRHDLGQEDHGSKLAVGTTRAIQGLLGLWIALTLVFVVYALIDATRATPSSPAPAAVGERAAEQR